MSSMQADYCTTTAAPKAASRKKDAGTETLLQTWMRRTLTKARGRRAHGWKTHPAQRLDATYENWQRKNRSESIQQTSHTTKRSGACWEKVGTVSGGLQLASPIDLAVRALANVECSLVLTRRSKERPHAPAADHDLPRRRGAYARNSRPSPPQHRRALPLRQRPLPHELLRAVRQPCAATAPRRWDQRRPAARKRHWTQRSRQESERSQRPCGRSSPCQSRNPPCALRCKCRGSRTLDHHPPASVRGGPAVRPRSQARPAAAAAPPPRRAFR
mmetsp:Transcript_119331/g.337576  ORF Transcript_119331/g.337576 Transcript_119331/m.337576 type:complete len:273 (-) Transcript_119331:638-1456(-)